MPRSCTRRQRIIRECANAVTLFSFIPVEEDIIMAPNLRRCRWPFARSASDTPLKFFRPDSVPAT
jgi:hypothetical protein